MELTKERLQLEVAVMSYIINFNPTDVPLTAADFAFDIIADIFRWWHEMDYVPTRHISIEESLVIDMCLDIDNASCGSSSFEADCKALKEWKDNGE